VSRPSLKVLHINAVNAIASTGRTVLDLSRAEAEQGFESRIAHSTGPQAENSYLIGTAAEKKVHAACSRLCGTQAYFSTAGTRRLLDYIAGESPDVVHLHNLHSNYINLPMLLEYLGENDIATVVTLHDCWFYTGKCCHYTEEGCYRWETGCGSCPRLALDNPSWFVDATARTWADKKRLFGRIPRLAVIGVSDWITAEAGRSFLSCARILKRIYNWADLGDSCPRGTQSSKQDLGWGDDFVILGVASRWSDAKGLSDFIALAEMVQRGAPHPEADDSVPGRTGMRIVLVGEIKRGVRLPSNVKHVRSTADVGELAAYYSSADVLLQLSREETFGKVVAEALSCGTPAIAYDSTANPELIGDGCGHVVASGDLAQVIDRIAEVRRNTKVSYSERCRAFAGERFSKDRQTGEYVDLYRELRDLRRAR
jgi:glycosyltransferase involved in cell wall biosynthesis